MRSDVRPTLLAIAAAALAIRTTPAPAQTLFTWPDTTVDVAGYSTIEECWAATERVRSGVDRLRTAERWRDTMPWNPRELLAQQAVPVTATASACMERFQEPKAPIYNYHLLLRLYLDAGRDSDAARLVERRLALVGEGRGERTAVIDTAVQVYLNEVHPVRLGAAAALIARERGRASHVAQEGMYAPLMMQSWLAGDTVRATRAARWLLLLADSLTEAERTRSPLFRSAMFRGLAFQAMRIVSDGGQAELDSLRHGTGPYVAFMRAIWAGLTGQRPEAMPIPVGERAPMIEADYWFPKAAADSALAAGHVSLLFFLDLATAGRIAEQAATLRRLAEHFPSLRITVAARTHGWFSYAAPPAPPEEAQLIWRWMKSNRVPGTLAVTRTPYRRLAPPDGRRIDGPTPNLTNYTFGNRWPVSAGSVFLVDSEGLVVYCGTLTRQLEAELSMMIDVLDARP